LAAEVRDLFVCVVVFSAAGAAAFPDSACAGAAAGAASLVADVRLAGALATPAAGGGTGAEATTELELPPPQAPSSRPDATSTGTDLDSARIDLFTRIPYPRDAQEFLSNLVNVY
jgi:hypothetical protein